MFNKYDSGTAPTVIVFYRTKIELTQPIKSLFKSNLKIWLIQSYPKSFLY